MGCLSCYDKIDRVTGRLFGQYGTFVARNPWTLIAISLIGNVLLGLGVTRIEIEDDIELLYTPDNSQSSQDRSTVQTLFGDVSATNFYPQSQTGAGSHGDIIFQSTDGCIISLSHISHIKTMYDKVLNITFTDKNNIKLRYSNVCAKRNAYCVVTGDIIFTPTFKLSILSNNITYPFFENVSVKEIFGNVKVENGTLNNATLIKLRFNLREDTESKENVKLWMKSFLEQMKTMSLSKSKTEIIFAHSNSLSDEISSNLDDDILLFALTFVFIILYASFATANWKCISDKQNLAKVGVLATLLSILGSIGLVSSCHVKFVTIVGVMPFLILGIGVDDMFVLLSGLAETYDESPKMEIEERISNVMKSSGVGITITTLTDIIAFFVGTSSSFLSVKNFCIFTGAAVLLCYLNYVTLFMACMTLHEQRVAEGKHCCSNKKVKFEEEINKGKPSMYSGAKPMSREDIEGPMEKYPQRFIAKIVLMKPAKVVIICIFIIYLGISIWGSLKFQQGLDLSLLVTEKSYLYKYNELDRTYFTKSVPISFVIHQSGGYASETAWEKVQKLQNDAENDVVIDPLKSLNWLRDFRFSPYYDNSSEVNFTKALRTKFLPVMPFYQNDIVFDDTSGLIKESRFFVFSIDTADINHFYDVMPRMRQIAKGSLFNPVTTYSPAFIFFEQYQTIVPETLQNLGMTVVAIFVVTSIFLPHPVLIFFITLTLVMILVGLFGFMYFWDLTLSFLTMIHIIMSVGFSVDFSAHICHGFMDTRSSDRQEGARGAIKKAGAPVFNGAVSSFVGISMLAFSKSYIFQSFFKVMLLIILFGAAHSLFFLPTILSLVGPKFEEKSEKEKNLEIPSEICVICNNKVYPHDHNAKKKFSALGLLKHLMKLEKRNNPQEKRRNSF